MIYPEPCRELWKSRKEKEAGLSPDPRRPYIMLNAFCLLSRGLFVSSELPALKEPWSISSEGRVATASFAELI